MYFELLKDYRQTSKVEHKLSDIILLTICAGAAHVIDALSLRYSE